MPKSLVMRDCMTPTPHTVGKAQTIHFAADLMKKHGIRHLPVLHGGELLGVVSDRDVALITSLDGVDPEKVRIEEAITQEPYSVKLDSKLSEVAAHMAEHKYGAAIVMDGNHVAGIFTTVDGMKILAKLLA